MPVSPIPVSGVLRRLRCSGSGYDAVTLIGLKHRTCSLSGSIDSQSEGSLSKTESRQITVEDNGPPPTERRHRRIRLPSSGRARRVHFTAT